MTAGQPNGSAGRDREHLPGRLRVEEPGLLALVASLCLLSWAYWPNLQELYTIWSTEPNYSHGFLVVPISIAIFWMRMSESGRKRIADSPPRWSWILLAVVLAARALAYERNSQWLETATIVPAVAALILACGGWPLLERGWPAVVFLLFMLPLPPTANNLVALPLQNLAALGSVYVMQLTGMRALQEGNIIRLPDNPESARTLEVAMACNGLSMLMTLAATVTATIMIVPLANWKRIVILLSAIPIALLSNVIRIVATGWFYSYVTSAEARHRAHDYSGYMMMPLALILVGLEVLVLSWLAGPPGEEDDDRMVFAVIPPAAGEKSKTKTLVNEL